MELSIIIPAYNEAGKIERDLRAAEAFLAGSSRSAEVLIVDDGSQDGTRDVVQAFIGRRPELGFRLLSYGTNRGKGHAVKYGILRAQGDVVAFVDAGLCVPLPLLERGIEKLAQGYDYAVASRRVPGTKIVSAQPLYRRIGSKVFWIGMRAVMGIEVSDTQCGFKLYRRSAAHKIYGEVRTDGFMFDIEALMIAKELRLKGAEFPVDWSNDRDTRYNPLVGTFRNVRELLLIRWRRLGGSYWIRETESA